MEENKSNTLVIIGVVTIAIVVIAGIFLFKNRADAPTDTQNITVDTSNDMIDNIPSPSTTPTPITSSGTPTAATTKNFTIEGGNYFFKPNSITVNKGDTVKITLKNSEGMHDLKIDAFNVGTKKLSSTQEETITFVADKAGSFEYYCSIGDHRNMGMKGTLIVK